MDSSAAAERMKKRRLDHGRAPRFSLDLPGDADVKKALKDKLSLVKTKLVGSDPSRQVTMTTVLETVLDAWIIQQLPDMPSEESSTEAVNPYTDVSQDSVNQPLFFTCQDSVNMLQNLSAEHYAKCREPLCMESHITCGHSMIVHFKCKSGHGIHWKSSPTLPNGRTLADQRFVFGYFLSGMLPSQYERLCDGANIGRVGPKKMDGIFKDVSKATKSERDDSCKRAVEEEILSQDEIGREVRYCTIA